MLTSPGPEAQCLDHDSPSHSWSVWLKDRNLWQYPFLLILCSRHMSPAVLLLIVDISFPCSHLFYSLHFEAEPCCTIYQWLSKCINRSYPRHSNLDANILPPQCKGPFGDWEGEISQQSPAKHHHFWFVLTIDSVCWFFRVFRSFLRTSKGTSKVNTAQTPRHANQTLDLPSAKKGENNIRGWKGMKDRLALQVDTETRWNKRV